MAVEAYCSKRMVMKTNCTKNMAYCSKNIVLLLNCSKSIEVEA